MYPRNAASPPRLSIGAVVQISDGAVQTSGVSIKVRPEGGAASAGGGTTAYEEGIVLYTPTQAETNYTAFVVIAYKTGCVPVSLAVVTTNSTTSGTIDLSALATASALSTVDDFLDTEVAAILAAVDTEVGAIKTKTDFLPSATAGASGGLFIAGTNAATTITTSLTTTFTGNLTGSVGSVTGAVGSVTGAVASVTGAVGSVTGNVGGNVTGSVGSVASGGITAASLDATVQARLGIVAYGTAQAATGTTLQLASASAFADDELVGSIAFISGGTTGVGQSRVITDYVSSTDTATVDTWTTTPTGTITYVVFSAPPASATALPGVNVKQINDVEIVGDGDGTPFDVA